MKKYLIISTALSLIGYSMCNSESDNNQKLFENRIWVDKVPQKETDLMNIVAFVCEEGDEAGMGINLNQSMWHLD